jgi:phage host-nuclease inhibitor protein Gam
MSPPTPAPLVEDVMDVTELIRTAEENPPAKPLGATDEIEAYEDDANPEVRGLAWRIPDLAAADWALRRLAECEEEAAEVDRQAAAAIEAIRARAEELKTRSERGASYFRFQLTLFAETHRADLLTGKKKSRDFVHGRLGFRSSPERLKVADKDALEAWLAVQPVEHGLYRVKLEPEMRVLNDGLKCDGFIPPGCEVEPSRESVTIEANAPEAALMKKGA